MTTKSGKKWSSEDDKMLIDMVDKKVLIKDIAEKLKRTELAIGYRILTLREGGDIFYTRVEKILGKEKFDIIKNRAKMSAHSIKSELEHMKNIDEDKNFFTYNQMLSLLVPSSEDVEEFIKEYNKSASKNPTA